jgi:hypothetical protein
VIAALTVWQPWASLIAIGAKPFEFRGWRAPTSLIGKHLAIHAGARPVRIAEVRALLVRLHSAKWAETGLLRDPAIALLERVKAGEALPMRSVVCVVRVGEPVDGFTAVESIGAVVNDSDRAEHANWGWPMLEVECLDPPIAAAGKQGLWRWSRPSSYPWEEVGL